MEVTEAQINSLITVGRLKNSENDLQRIPIQKENELLTKIRNGLYNEILISDYSTLDSHMGQMAHSPLIQFTYTVVSSIAIFSRIAIEEDVPADDIFDLSDALLFALSFCKSIEEIHTIHQLSATMIAKQIHMQKQEKNSYLVERIRNYVSRNIYKKIKLNEIAEYMNLSPNYLCSIFSKEMDLTLYQYIQQEKINISCNLLMHTTRTISDLALYMGFATQSNFTKVFHKWKHMTPSEFRDKYYREVY